MKKNLVIIIAGFILLLSILTNPNQDRHKEIVKNKIHSILQSSNLIEINNVSELTGYTVGMILSNALADLTINNLISTNNYICFSTTKITWGLNTKVIGIGAFGNVYLLGETNDLLNIFFKDNFQNKNSTKSEFHTEKERRYSVTKQRLKEIYEAELAYKKANDKFTENWDSLITFLKEDSLPYIPKTGLLADSMINAGLNEEKAVKQGLINNDTISISQYNYLFGPNYPVDQIRYVPIADTIAEFHLKSTIHTTRSGVKISRFEAKAHNNTILKNLDPISVIKLNDSLRMNDKYPGLKIGSLIENNSKGNWEN